MAVQGGDAFVETGEDEIGDAHSACYTACATRKVEKGGMIVSGERHGPFGKIMRP
ncbi:hypothetical protein BGE01nite_43150 [Brevifollis gellanilyticus]|uniref:Uncharacterized protein n=1 Tax=Brevifollis gellanilyticus TaxID=748831 RepID=A0A512ME58_9BACT|nr:hypothetical protein BGE01nite_43150 [Brevifollis gellanilyticus]